MPEFNRWLTRFDELAAISPDTRTLPLKDQVALQSEMLRSFITSGEMDMEGGGSEMLRTGEEYLWILDGKPYYNIHPKLVHHLCNCNLDNLPASYLEVPGGFRTVLIRFAGPHPELQVEGDEYVRCILMSRSLLGVAEVDFVELFDHGIAPSGVNSTTDRIVLRIDLGDRGMCGDLSYIREWTIGFRLLRDRTLNEDFAGHEPMAPRSIASGTRRRQVLENCLRLIATVGFIANSPEKNLLEYDVLARDRAAFAVADEERRQTIIKRARRRGKVGWNVGTNELFLGEMPCWSRSSSTGTTVREHTHAHIRGGHLHAVRCGPGRNNVKVKWFRPTVVRPDLPFMAV